MRKFFFTHIASIIFLFAIGSHTTNSQFLSDSAQISLLTCNPGNELYSVFGHSAIRINDPLKHIDWVYNYGTFNFSQPGFYIKFVRGHLNYQLSVYHMRDFYSEYLSENRSIYEQVLNFSNEEKQLIFKFLEFNRLPENKFYLYDFFFDNCASRIRDVFQRELKQSIQFSDENYQSKTFREMLKSYLEPHPWSRFGINLVLGTIADRKATLDESMFLPDYMNMAFENAKLKTNGSMKPLVSSSNTIFEQKPTENENPFYSGPGFVFSILLLLILALSYLELKNGRNYKIIDFTVFFSIGLVGLILFLLWFATDHTAVVKNWNLLWALPTHLFFAFLVFKKAKSAFLKYYFLITGIVAFSIIPLWTVLPQRFDLAFIPLILILTLRSYQMYRFHR